MIKLNKKNKVIGVFIGLKIIEIFTLVGVLFLGHFVGGLIMEGSGYRCGFTELHPCGEKVIDNIELTIAGTFVVGMSIGIIFFIVNLILLPLIKANWNLAKKIIKIRTKGK